ncbi:MAG: VPDSG-CTERM sorting domain-containing protein [Nostocaceae cyanobacterium]|nr:VPDSG-CTERM sorting domain-containing protein [Nostocaceae cyanobacterium]
MGNASPLTITFDTPVTGAGTQIAVDDTANFTVFISAFDENNHLLGTFAQPGTSSLELDNSAIFLGVVSHTSNIKTLVYSSSEPEKTFAINKLSLVRVPDSSSTIGLLAFGILGTNSILKRKLKQS